MMKKVDHLGRLSKWCIEVGEYDANYEARKAIKVQALADFIAKLHEVERTLLDLDDGEPEWMLFVDGASGSGHQGAGVIVCGLDALEASKAIKFGFQVTNNMAKYEAIIVGLQLAK